MAVATRQARRRSEGELHLRHARRTWPCGRSESVVGMGGGGGGGRGPGGVGEGDGGGVQETKTKRGVDIYEHGS